MIEENTEPPINKEEPEASMPFEAEQPSFKETAQIEFSNGTKIMLGSCSLRVDLLCEIIAQMKKDLLETSNSKGNGSYLG